MKTKKRLKSGFTLIELLVVITIIAILAAILFPVFASVRDKARATACLSNNKQIGLAFQQYTQDYDEVIPGAGGANRVLAYLYPYIKSKTVFMCPSDPNKTVPGSGQVYISYATNQDLFAYSSTKQLQLSQLIQPTLTVVTFENTGKVADPSASYTNIVPVSNLSCNFATPGSVCPNVSTGPLGGTCAFATPLAPGTTSGSCPTQCCYSLELTAVPGRHNGGANYIMCDGHAKWLPGTKVSVGNNPIGHGNSDGVAVSTGFWADGTNTAQSKQEVTFSFL